MTAVRISLGSASSCSISSTASQAFLDDLNLLLDAMLPHESPDLDDLDDAREFLDDLEDPLLEPEYLDELDELDLESLRLDLSRRSLLPLSLLPQPINASSSSNDMS